MAGVVGWSMLVGGDPVRHPVTQREASMIMILINCLWKTELVVRDRGVRKGFIQRCVHTSTCLMYGSLSLSAAVPGESPVGRSIPGPGLQAWLALVGLRAGLSQASAGVKDRRRA
jgi:hypothetical protein